jgi:hypothetical protein
MTITLKIDNPDIEEQLKEFVKEQKELTLEALNGFVNSFQKQEKLVYRKRDPKKYSRIIQREYNPEDADDVALSYIEDSAKYVHDLRRAKNR